jgi:hypothetical protein
MRIFEGFPDSLIFGLAARAVAPTVVSISPAFGSTAGDTVPHVLAGSGFAGVAASGAVTIGGAAATYTVDSDSQITITAMPARTAGTHDVVVTRGGLTGTLAAGYKAFSMGLWYRPDSYVAGTGNAIAQLDDLSGAVNHATQATAGNRLNRIQAVKNGRSVIRQNTVSESPGQEGIGGGTGRMLITNSIAYPCTVVAVSRCWTGALSFLINTGAGVGFSYESDKYGAYGSGHAPSAYSAKLWGARIMRYTSRTAINLRTNGASESLTTAGQLGAGQQTLFDFTGGGGFTHAADCAEIFVINGAISDADCEMIETYLNARYRANYVICHGNSLTGGPSFDTSYPTQTRALLGDEVDYTIAGTAGMTTPTMITEAATRIDTRLSSWNKANILVGWEGRNHVVVSGASAATAYSSLATYYAARQAAGWKVVAATVLPSQSLSNVTRATLNQSIRDNWQTFADALADLAADPTIGPDGANSNATYYSDTIHLTAAGNAVAAQVFADAIEPLLE